MPIWARASTRFRAGLVGATVMDVVDFLMERRRDPGLEDGLELGTAGSTAWGVRKTDPELKGALDDYVRNVKKTATWGRLAVKYFGEDALRVLGRGPNPGSPAR
jgi:membrane-bound lytic murein transglycosylase MltF